MKEAYDMPQINENIIENLIEAYKTTT